MAKVYDGIDAELAAWIARCCVTAAEPGGGRAAVRMFRITQGAGCATHM
jgi:hypothetical protein